ncbi:MAG: response regulator [Deltaproteobacteria bacterium]|nr:response regulator [Deltaproteobacteria bacterium]MBW2129959.1 response regulator [Deltaproteobacteria bacterium]MBW2304255.1 response regulator [Deltaproteobacteria bacterium]
MNSFAHGMEKPEMEWKILVVDDDPISREMVAMSLKKMGYSVDLAEGVEEAIEQTKKEEYAVIITDKNMPDGKGEEEGGMELLKYAKTRLPSTAVIMMTAYASVESAIEAMKLGAFDYLTKPLDNAELREKIDRIRMYKGFLNPEITFRIYKTLHNEILSILEKRGGLSDEQLRKSLKKIDRNIDHFFKAQQEWERIFLLQRNALGEIAILAEQLLERMDESDPRMELIEKICESAAQRI